MSRYNTEQRRSLMTFLRSHPDCQYSARQLADALEQQNISLSAVYRNLAALEAAGLISRFAREGCREVYYQFTGASDCVGCIHMTCVRCGKTMHMDPGSADELLCHVLQRNGFAVDKNKTVVYGVCRRCCEK